MEIFINRMEAESMTQVVQESVRMLEMLPESGQELASLDFRTGDHVIH